MPKICRIASFPSADSQGVGLPGYQLCRTLANPTLFLTRKTDDPLPVGDHIDLRMIDYPSPAFSEKLNAGVGLKKIFGILKFLFVSIIPMTRFRPDILHIHSPLYLLHAAWARFVLRSKICMTFHGSDLLRIKKSPFLKWILPRLVDLFFHVSLSMRPDLESFLPHSRIIYTPNGVDLDKFRDLGLSRKKQVVAVGNLRWQKGYKYLIDAFSSLTDTRYDLVIAGEGPLRDELERQIREIGLAGTVRMPGRLDHDQLVELLGESSIYVMSSVSEGFPKALLEAMACGLPVVTTNAGCCHDVAVDSGICVDCADSEALATALRMIIEDEGLRRSLASQATASAAGYSWDISCDIVSSAYDSLCV